jgi:hypothetical protein
VHSVRLGFSLILLGLRAEWAKTRARAYRWKEEIILLEEEMRRAIEFCWHMSREWTKRKEARSHRDPHVLEGLQAYASEQHAVETARATLWFTAWGSIRHRAKDVLVKKLGDVEEDLGDVSEIIIPEDDTDQDYTLAHMDLEEYDD